MLGRAEATPSTHAGRAKSKDLMGTYAHSSIMWCSAASSTTCSAEVPDLSTFVERFLTTSCGVSMCLSANMCAEEQDRTIAGSRHIKQRQTAPTRWRRSRLPSRCCLRRVEWNCGEKDFVHKKTHWATPSKCRRSEGRQKLGIALATIVDGAAAKQLLERCLA